MGRLMSRYYGNNPQPDPRYFDFGNAFLGGIQNAQNNQRQNALLDMEKQQFGMQQDRHAMAVDQYGRSLQADQAAGQQAAAEREALASLLESEGLPVEWANLPKPMLIARLDAHEESKKPGKLVADHTGVLVPEAPGVRVRDPAAQGATEAPSDQRLYEWLKRQSPEDQQKFLEMRRGYAGPEGASAMEFAKTSARENAKSRVESKNDLPRVEANANAMLDVLSLLETSPGFDWVYGVKSVAPVIPGTPQADAVAIWEQLQGKAFMQAFQTLKGGGQITEKEGEKATAAITRLANRKQSPEAARQAASELRKVVTDAVETARAKALGGQPSGAGRGDADNDPLGIRTP